MFWRESIHSVLNSFDKLEGFHSLVLFDSCVIVKSREI